MIFFVWNFGGGQGGRGGIWDALPLLIFIPILISNVLFGGGGFSASWVYDSATGQWQRASSSTPSINQGAGILTLVASVILVVVFLLAASRRQPRGGADAQGGAAAAPTHRERLSAAAAIIQQLPIELHHTKEELSEMGISELKTLLQKAGRGNVATHCVEKSELVEAVLAGANSTAETCSICVEDYEAGDPLRVLPCGHKFHLDCVDRWILSSTDFSRPAACPVCNAEVKLKKPGESNNE